MTYVLESLKDAQKTLNDFVSNETNVELISKATQLMVDSYKANGRVFSCGNGGSMCDAMHFAEELTGRFRKREKTSSCNGHQ